MSAFSSGFLLDGKKRLLLPANGVRGKEEKCVKVGILLLFSGWEQKQTEQGPVRWSARAPEWLPPWVGMAIGGVELGLGWVLEAGCMGPTHIRHVYQSG